MIFGKYPVGTIYIGRVNKWKHTSPNVWTCIDEGTGPYAVGETHVFLYDNLHNWFSGDGVFQRPFSDYLKQCEL